VTELSSVFAAPRFGRLNRQTIGLDCGLLAAGRWLLADRGLRKWHEIITSLICEICTSPNDQMGYARLMPRSTAVGKAFRLTFRRPMLPLAEIAWRWAFGIAAIAVTLLLIRQSLAAVDVSEVELALARRSGLFLAAVPALSVLWIIGASIGRGVTLAAVNPAAETRARRFGPLAGINALRALLTLSAIGAWIGSMILASAAFPPREEHAASAVMLWLLLAVVIGFCWSVVNWFLSLAPIFVLRDGRGIWGAVRDSLDLLRLRPRAYLSIAAWFGLWRMLLIFVALLLGGIAFAAAGSNAPAVVVSETVLALAYFALADWLQIARLAAYVFLADEPLIGTLGAEPELPAPAVPQPSAAPTAGVTKLLN